MYVIVGLGNYGREYAHTWHNAGCDSLNILAQRNGISLSKKRFKALIGEGAIAGEKCVLAFPQTYMNNSGDAVLQLVNFFKPDLSRLVVLYDDADLPKAALRLRATGGTGTHNGMRSIVASLGASNFPRVRIGIGQPPEFMDIKDYVLGKVQKSDREAMFAAYTKAAQSVEAIVKSGIDAAMRDFNGV